jgi:hypothetical protein
MATQKRKVSPAGKGKKNLAKKVKRIAKAVDVQTVLTTEDMILPDLQLPKPCPIRIEIDNLKVSLFVGQRDFQWSRITGEHIASGTMLEKSVPDVQKMSDADFEAYNKGCAEAVEEEQK